MSHIISTQKHLAQAYRSLALELGAQKDVNQDFIREVMKDVDVLIVKVKEHPLTEVDLDKGVAG